MAYLRNLQTQEKHYLQPHHNVGRRGKAVDTCIDYPEISNIHTIIQWDTIKETWSIRDVSRNGTWLEDERMPIGENIILERGQTIRFASPNNVGWVVEDLSPPCNLLVPISPSAKLIELSSYQLLPDSENPVLALHLSPDTGHWQLEYFEDDSFASNPEVNQVSHGDRIFCPEYEWELFLTEFDAPTESLFTEVQNLNQFTFIFRVSQDEESTTLSLQHESGSIELEERAHHYALLHLARQRVADMAKGLDSSSQGWAYNDQLAQELGMELPHLNIQIFRARQHIAEKIPKTRGMENLVQRRKGSMRFGCPHFKIYKGSNLECESTNASCQST